jgi:hypothetical protein
MLKVITNVSSSKFIQEVTLKICILKVPGSSVSHTVAARQARRALYAPQSRLLILACIIKSVLLNYLKMNCRSLISK